MTSAYGPPVTSGMCAPKKVKRPKPEERLIQDAIIQAFQLRHRIKLEVTNAGGAADKKGVMRCPKSLRAALGLPQVMPFGIEAWVALPPGFPDLCAQLDGRLLFIEVKRPGGAFRAGQKDFLSARVAEGHLAFWADSVPSALAQFEAAVRVAS